MATATISSSPNSGAAVSAPSVPASSSDPSSTEPTQALVPTADGKPFTETAEEEPEISGPLALLPIELDVTIPVREFRVKNLLALEPGQLVETQWHSGEDVPLASGPVQMAWSEFEVLESELAVRITHMA